MGGWPCGVSRKPTARKLTRSRMPTPSARSDSRLLDDSFPPRNSPRSEGPVRAVMLDPVRPPITR
jgi:hypothetical protein